MIPFSEFTVKETGLTHRKPWDKSKADARLKQIRDKHHAALCRRDAERARAAGLDVSGDRLSVLVSDGNGNVSVDPIASKIHHSGAELIDLVKAEWYEFCSKPQNEPDVDYPTMTYQPKEPRKLGQQSTQNQAMNVTDMPSERRRPGRPRKSEFGT